MVVYIDADFRCHAQKSEGLTAVASEFFDGKCKTFIESYRFVPRGSTWTREDGAAFSGEMITPHTDLAPALAAQSEFEAFQANAADYVAAYNEGVQGA